MVILKPKMAAAPFAHVKTEFAYGSGVVELGLGGFLGSPRACYRHFGFSVITPIASELPLSGQGRLDRWRQGKPPDFPSKSGSNEVIKYP